ncbi:MAG: PP2C family protein-serine/threonine phosphatase [Acidobacteriota bacterium]
MTARLDTSRLESLLESAQLLHSTLNLEDLLRHLLRTVMGRLLVGRALIAVAHDGVQQIALVRGTPRLVAGGPFDETAARAAGIESIHFIGPSDQPVGLLGLGPASGGALAAEERDFLNALLGIAASGIVNARIHTQAHRLNRDLDQKIQDLRALLDLVRGLTSSLEPGEVARLLALTLAGRWLVRRYSLTVWKEGHPSVCRQKGMDLPGLEKHEPLLKGLPDAIATDELADSELKRAMVAQQAAVLFPIRSSDRTLGIVALGPRAGQFSYEKSDLEFGAGLVAQAAVAFENSWYFRETLQRQWIEQELELAASIQQELFPTSLPSLTGFDIAARSRPARQVGGDYYDTLLVSLSEPTRSHLLCLADVSGKGLPAALLMSSIQATLRALLGHVPSLVDLAGRTSELLYATTPSNKYATAILVEVNPAAETVRYVNAGHVDCVLLQSGGGVEWLKSTGPPLGLLPHAVYEEKSLPLQPGDLVALYSDGVTEAWDRDENEFGEARLLDCLRRVTNEPAATVVTRMIEEVDRFAGAALQHDDITLMVLKRLR